MSKNSTRLLGFVVWQGGKWYVRRRLADTRRLRRAGLLAGAGLITVVVIARRSSG
jgi:hypothetical protein